MTLVLNLGDRHDKVLLGDTTSGITRLDLGDGNDTPSDLDRAGTLSGGNGSDVLRPGPGTDTVPVARASTLRFTVSGPVGLTVAVSRLAAGRRAGGRCVTPTPRLVRKGARR